MRKLCVTVLCLLAFTVPAWASPCGTTPGLDTTEVTFRTIASDNCAGVIMGNINPQDFPNTIPAFGSTPFQGPLSEGGSFVFDGVTFGLTVDSVGQTSGTWTLTFESDPSTTIVADLAVYLKASDRYAVYFFDNESFTTNGSGEGTFSISFLNNGGQTPALSHLDVGFRQGEGTCCTQVTSLSSLSILGLGALVMAGGLRLRKPRRRPLLPSQA